MNIFTGIIVYLMIFFTSLFAVLPWGNEPEDDETREKGMAGSAPRNPRIKEKLFITACLSCVIWGIVFALIHYKVIDFYAIAYQMVEEDKLR